MKKNLLGVSLLTLVGLYGFLAAFVILIFIIAGLPVIGGIGISIIVLVIQFFISPYITDFSMKFFYKAKFDYEIPAYLKEFIESVCKDNNMKYPRMGFIDDGAPNAFTYGHTKNDARVVITRGILELLSEEEVKAVVAHELGHASHYDMLFMTVAQLIPLVLYGIYTILTSNISDDNDNRAKLALIGYVAYFLYLISEYIILWLSRSREYYADSFSVEATKNPAALAEALVKVGYGLTTKASQTNSGKLVSNSNALGIFDSKTSKSLVASSYDNGVINKENIKNAMKWEKWNVWASLYELNSTHPLISKRIEAISSRASEFNQEPYINFDIKKEESYVDDFFIELLVVALPTISLFGCGIVSFIVTLNPLLSIGIGCLVCSIFSFIKLGRSHKNKGYTERKIVDLLGEVKVSGITSIPCILKGRVIGRGDPGCMFNEDFTIQDDTGIIFIDYNQPIIFANEIFALFKAKKFIGEEVTVTGWYRRSPVPYVEILTIESNGKVKKCHTYGWMKILNIIFAIISIGLIVSGLFM